MLIERSEIWSNDKQDAYRVMPDEDCESVGDIIAPTDGGEPIFMTNDGDGYGKHHFTESNLRAIADAMSAFKTINKYNQPK